MRNIKLNFNYVEYPYILQLFIDDRLSGIYIISSPFGNCQTFCINNTIHLCESLTDEEILEFFKQCFQKVGKKQFVIDICNKDSKKIFDKLNPVISESKDMPYMNANGTPMTLYLLTLDLNKIT